MARKKSTENELELEEGVSEETDGVRIDNAVEWLLRVRELVGEGYGLDASDGDGRFLLRGKLGADVYEILSREHRDAGMSPEDAAAAVGRELDRSREWMLSGCAWHAMIQGFQSGTALEFQGSIPTGWFMDYMRWSIHQAREGRADHVVRMIYYAEKQQHYPIAMPAAPFRREFEARGSDLIDRFTREYLKV